MDKTEELQAALRHVTQERDELQARWDEEMVRRVREQRTGYSGLCACGARVGHDGDYARCDACKSKEEKA